MASDKRPISDDALRAEARDWLARNWTEERCSGAAPAEPAGQWGAPEALKEPGSAEVVDARWAVLRWPEAWHGPGLE